MESELFGHRKGSFTGAVADSEGLFRRAEGGSLFLDEVAELPLHMQVKLLRAVQERSVRPVGGSEEVPVDARVLSASHKDLCRRGGRGALPQRPLLPPERHIDPLAEPARAYGRHSSSRPAHTHERNTGRRQRPSSLDPGAIARLERYRFPGNVRELENLLELSGGDGRQ